MPASMLGDEGRLTTSRSGVTLRCHENEGFTIATGLLLVLVRVIGPFGREMVISCLERFFGGSLLLLLLL